MRLSLPRDVEAFESLTGPFQDTVWDMAFPPD